MLYPFGKLVTHWLVMLLYRMRYEGLENIPKTSGFILACNHRTNFDPLFIAHKVKQPLHYMAKAELFRGRFMNWLFHSINAFPVDRGKGDTAIFDTAGAIIKCGEVVGMFPEGHRSKDGTPLRPRSGVALIAAQTGADVLPAAVCYGAKLGFRTVVTVRYGALISSEQLGARADSPATVRSATKRIMGEIIALLEAKEG